MLSILLVLAMVILVIMVWIMWTQVIGSGWGPTPMKKVREMLEMGGVSSADLLYDLGCGDGRIITEAASRYGARAVGIEADPLRFIWSRMAIRGKGLGGRVRVVHGNFFHEDLQEATIVTMFLQQGTNQRLREKLLRELRPGTKVITYTWTFEGWHPIRSNPSGQVYVYEIGTSERPL
ncbi:MAG: class I SAM-dependent methyltransferase [Nitrososphaerota archaeon]|nr:class I SAM-dependent methyltransferase [Nitrososphaerota archaeon]